MTINKSNVLFIFCLVFSMPFLVAQNTFYVATNGNDSNSGTKTSPFKTFNRAMSQMTPGSTCIIRGGTYDERLVVSKDGTVGNYLTFKAEDGERVEVKATKVINGWQAHAGSIYKTTVDMSLGERFRSIYHYGEYMDLARWPNNTDDDRWTIDCKFIDSGGSDFFELTDVPNFDWTGGYVYYLGGHSGTSWIREITSSSTTRIEHVGVDITKWPFDPHNPTILRNGHRGQLYLFNKLEALDHANEWYYDDATNTLYFQTSDGNIPEDDSVEYTTHRYTSEINGDYVKVEGIEFFGGGIKVKGDFNIIENNKISHAIEGFADASQTSGASVGDAAIEVLGESTVVRGCTINHSSFNGIIVNNWADAHNSIIEKNTISNVNYVGIHTTPIRSTANNVKVLKNTVFNSGRDGIYVSGDNCEVAYNDVSKAQLINADSGVFYTVGNDDLKGTEIHHNWFHDSKPPSFAGTKAAGIYLDNNSKGYVVHHNVVWNVSWSAYQVNWANWNLDFFHNTIWNAERASDSWVNGYEQKNNRVYNNYSNVGDWFTVTGFEMQDNLIDATSPLEDPDALNFMPIDGSAVVDMGRVISGFSKIFKGAAPDIGAYERGGTPWTAGINAIEDTGSNTLSTEDNIVKDDIVGVLYPNPVKDKFSILLKDSFDRKGALVEIYSVLGAKIASYDVEDFIKDDKLTLSMTDLSAGNYIVKLVSQQGTNNKIFVKE
ncbi:right-handed parallel beta-helix repeat-containing protein [Tenacibaculum sp. M341]|uniref:right-handed parallel beta-helix repeat-containing protein n=1 Tax=Tenacibaculum sp. M341 TaxID=2530339 RepID=UPI001043F89E|nr:right-handed parallel beta-helix repeat-containing protein [Tenacibaculum sp. M341]TCI94337.1 T9SS type A sorting domain-containing protein [Tenacibaculum sp. M341]